MLDPGRTQVPYPNLLLVGFVKCGTTSLAKYLTDHPRVAAPVAKELYYLIDDRSNLRSMQPIIQTLTFGKSPVQPGPHIYLDFFPDIAGCRYALDATPFYYSQRAALEYAAANSDVRVLFLVRDPVHRLSSSFRYFQNVFQEYPDGSFEEFVAALLDSGSLRERYRARIRKPFFQKLFDDELDMGHYARHIARWIERLGRSRVFVGKVEAMQGDPIAFMRQACSFLDIESAMYDGYAFRTYMRSYRVRLPMLQKIGRRLGKEDPIRYDRMTEYQSPFHHVSIDWLRRACDGLYGLLQRTHDTDSFSHAALEQLAAYYDDANRELATLVGIEYRSRSPGASRELNPVATLHSTASGRRQRPATEQPRQIG